MPALEPRSPARRSDAARNRDKILAVARVALAEPEPVSMAEIARRANVGAATLYRNFPGRRELLESVFIDEVDAVCAAAETVEGDSPGARFEAWLDRFFAFFTTKRTVGAELLTHTDDDPHPFFSANRDRVLAAGRPLLTAAQRSNDVRGDITLEQILDMVIAIAAISGNPGYLQPIVATVLDGLRPQGRPSRSRRRR